MRYCILSPRGRSAQCLGSAGWSNDCWERSYRCHLPAGQNICENGAFSTSAQRYQEARVQANCLKARPGRHQGQLTELPPVHVTKLWHLVVGSKLRGEIGFLASQFYSTVGSQCWKRPGNTPLLSAVSVLHAAVGNTQNPKP